MDNISIPLHQLKSSPLNARKSRDNAAVERMKASILAHGLLQRPVAVKDGKDFGVVIGETRWRALSSLHKEDKLPADYQAPCQLTDAEHAAELSLAENVIRDAMDPADEFEAFDRLTTEETLSVAEIATRFGVTQKHVNQRLKLGRVAPES